MMAPPEHAVDHSLNLIRRSLRAALGLGALAHAGCAYDFGDCDPTWATSLPKHDPDDVRTGGYLYTVEGLSEDACLNCDEACRIDIETNFTHDNPPRNMDVMCGPMWLDGTCAVAASITDPPDD